MTDARDLEYCNECDCETGNAGIGEDSLHCDGKVYCDDCWSELPHKQAQEIESLKVFEKACDKLTEAMGRWGWEHCVDADGVIEEIESLQAKHSGLLSWAEGAKLDNEGLKSRIGEIESALRIQTAATGYWKDHWDQAYSEQHGQPPQEPKDD